MKEAPKISNEWFYFSTSNLVLYRRDYRDEFKATDGFHIIPCRKDGSTIKILYYIKNRILWSIFAKYVRIIDMNQRSFTINQPKTTKLK